MQTVFDFVSVAIIMPHLFDDPTVVLAATTIVVKLASNPLAAVVVVLMDLILIQVLYSLLPKVITYLTLWYLSDTGIFHIVAFNYRFFIVAIGSNKTC